MDQKNQIWWGHGKGITKLDLNSFEVSQTVPAVQLNYVEINQEFVDFRRLDDEGYSDCVAYGTLPDAKNSVIPFYNYPERLKMPHNLNHLTFHFSAIDWVAPHKIQYQYRLNGIDKNWSMLRSDGVAEYRNIPSGQYTFEFRAIGESNVYSKSMSYPVEIVAPWYEHFWVRVIGVLMLIGVLYGLFKWRIRQLSQNQKVLMHIVSERTKELTELTEEMKVANKELLKKNEQISNQSEKLNAANEALNTVNANLEKMVKERTKELTVKNKTLSDYAFMNAHNLRVPVANIKGIIQLFDFKLTMRDKEELIEKLKVQSDDLDEALINITNRLDEDKLPASNRD